MSEVDLLRIYKEIEFMYNAISNIVNSFYALLGIVLAITTGSIIYLFKVWIKKFIEKEAKKVISKLLDSVSKPECYSGIEVLDNTKLVNDQYEFPLSDSITFDPNMWNRIILQPIKGNKQLEYECKVEEGRLKLKLKNFKYDEDIGVVWTIMYYPDMVKYMNS